MFAILTYVWWLQASFNVFVHNMHICKCACMSYLWLYSIILGDYHK